jgi:ATP-dependent RNA helicase HelY
LPLPDLDAQAAAYQSQLRAELATEIARVHDGLAETHRELHELQQRIEHHVCDPCPVRKQHRRNLREVARLMEDKTAAERNLQKHIEFEDKRAQRILGAIVSVLHQFGYLKRGLPTAKAAQLANVFDANGLLICETLGAGWLQELSPEDLAEVFSWFAYDRDLEFANRYMLPHQLVRLRRDLDELQAHILAAERRNELLLTLGYNYYFYGMARAWCRGAALGDILAKVDLGEGDLVMTFNKTIDLLRQVEEMLVKVSPRDTLREKLGRARRLMRRGIIEQSLALGIVPGLGGVTEAPPPPRPSPPPETTGRPETPRGPIKRLGARGARRPAQSANQPESHSERRMPRPPGRRKGWQR